MVFQSTLEKIDIINLIMFTLFLDIYSHSHYIIYIKWFFWAYFADKKLLILFKNPKKVAHIEVQMIDMAQKIKLIGFW